MPSGRNRFAEALRNLLGEKEDRPVQYRGFLGAYVDGVKKVSVASRPDYVYVRLRGATSEVVQAFNDAVGLHYDLPVIVERDRLQPNIWRIKGRDIGTYSDWGGASYVPPHGRTHSFVGGRGTGSDIVFVFKRQYMPFMPRPQPTGTAAIYIEPDYYYWNGAFRYWPGSGTQNLIDPAYLPTGAHHGRFVTVYLEGDSGTLGYLSGDEYDLVFPPDDPTTFIPVPAPDVGIPIAAVQLTTGTNRIGWHEIYDLRMNAFALPTTGSLVHVYDESVSLGRVGAMNFIGAGVTASTSGSFAFIEIPGGAGSPPVTGSMVLYDEQTLLGSVTRLVVEGDSLEASITGQFGYIRHSGVAGGAANPPITGSVVIYDENSLLGSVTSLVFEGAPVQASITGSFGFIRHSGTPGGGGGHETGTVVVYDEDTFLGVFEELRFIGAGVQALDSGSYAAISIPGAGGTGTYVRAGEAVPLATITGGYWKVPESEFMTGTLSVAVNGIWQTPIEDFTELYPSSGTFRFEGPLATGSIVSAIWGAPDTSSGGGGGGGGGAGTVVLLDEGVLLGDAAEFDFVGAGVDASLSGTRAQVNIPGGGGGAATGTVVVYDEDTFLGVFEELRFIGSGVQALNSGSYAAISISGGGGAVHSYAADPIMKPPDSPDPYDQEFHTTGSATLVPFGSITPNVSLIDSDVYQIESGGNGSIHGIAAEAPSGSFTAYCRLMPTRIDNNYNSVIMVAIHGDPSSPTANCQTIRIVHASTLQIYAATYNTSYVFSSNQANVPRDLGGGIFFKFDFDGSDLTVSFSNNGFFWYDLHTFASISAIDYVGLGVEESGGGTVSAIFDWLRFNWTPDFDFSTDGEGGGGGAGTVVLLDEGVSLGDAAELDFVGAGVDASLSGTRAQVNIPGSGATGTFSWFNLDNPKPTADTPDDEFGESSLDGKWTAVNGSTGTVSLIQSANVSIYDLITRPGSLLVQAGKSGAQQVSLRQDYTLPTGSSIVVSLAPTLMSDGVPAIVNNELWMGMALNDNDTNYDQGNWLGVLMDANDNGWRLISYDGSTIFGGTPNTSKVAIDLAERVYLRIARHSTTYYTYYSFDGKTWFPVGSTSGTIYNNLWLFVHSKAAFGAPIPIQAFDWVRQGSNAIDPWNPFMNILT